MSLKLPPAPLQEKEFGDSWRNWFLKVREMLSGLSTLSWSLIDFTGSKLSDILDRKHNDLQSIQGGSSSEYYHLSLSNYNKVVGFIDTSSVSSVSTSTTLDDSAYTVYITASGTTQTLPVCSSSIIGLSWTVILSTIGTVDIVPNGADIIILPSGTAVRLNIKGSSMTFKCISASEWGIV